MRFSSPNLCTHQARMGVLPVCPLHAFEIPSVPAGCATLRPRRCHVTTAFTDVAPPGTRDKVSRCRQERNSFRTICGPTHFPGGQIDQLAPLIMVPGIPVAKSRLRSTPASVLCSTISYSKFRRIPSSRKWDDHDHRMLLCLRHVLLRLLHVRLYLVREVEDLCRGALVDNCISDSVDSRLAASHQGKVGACARVLQRNLFGTTLSENVCAS
jgi:hypothetical protein